MAILHWRATLQTTAAIFLQWLYDYVDYHRILMPQLDDYDPELTYAIRLLVPPRFHQPGGQFDDGGFWRMSIVQVAPERIDVTADFQSTNPQAERAFCALTDAIGYYWPESGLKDNPAILAAVPNDDSDGDRADDLSERDREIIRLWREGWPAGQIGMHLCISAKTVYNRICQLRGRYPDLLPYRRYAPERKTGQFGK